jgi:hypothetical protein
METDQYVSVNELRKSLIDEIIKSVGLPRTPFWRKIFSPIFWLPTDRFSRFGSNFDKLLTKSGFNKAFINALSFFVGDVEVHGGNNIPKKGPLLVVSNHPGTYDTVVIAAHLPRNDVKIVSSDIPFIQKMRNANRHFLFTTRDTYKRMIVIKRAIRHLRDGGAILIFPSGHIDPEPAFMPEAMKELEMWSRVVEIFLSKVPETNIQVAIVSNVLSQKYFRNLLTRLRKHWRDRQRIAEFLQVIDQMVFRKKSPDVPKISFAEVFGLKDISESGGTKELMPYVISRAKEMMALHIQADQ